VEPFTGSMTSFPHHNVIKHPNFLKKVHLLICTILFSTWSPTATVERFSDTNPAAATSAVSRRSKELSHCHGTIATRALHMP